MDLSLPDSKGLESFMRIQNSQPLTPVVILSDEDDENIAIESVKRGAQDYLVKNQTDGRFLPRIINYNIERARLQIELRKLSLIDDLTGLYNRRGFLTLAEQHIKLIQRTHRGFILFALDLDGFKEINDTWGHSVGDQALKDAAQIMRITFRKSDIVARLGGDEFVALALETNPQHPANILKRLQQNLTQYNEQAGREFQLSFSTGDTFFDANDEISLDNLLKQADRAMYQHKKRHIHLVKKA